MNINIFGYSNKSVFTIRISKENYDDHMELLYIKEKGTANHYVYIKDFNRLMYNFTKHKERKHFFYALSAMFLFKYKFSKTPKRLYCY